MLANEPLPPVGAAGGPSELTHQVSAWLRELGQFGLDASAAEADGWDLSPSVVARWCVGDTSDDGALPPLAVAASAAAAAAALSLTAAPEVDPVTPESPALLLWAPPALPPRGGDSDSGQDAPQAQLPPLEWPGASDPASWLPLMQRWQQQQHEQQLEMQEIQQRQAALERSDSAARLPPADGESRRASKRPRHAAAAAPSTTPDIPDRLPTPREASAAAGSRQQRLTPKKYKCPLAGCGRCFSTNTGLHTHTGWHRRKQLIDSGEYDERAHPSKKNVSVTDSDGTVTTQPVFCCVLDGCTREFPSRAALATHAGWHRRQRNRTSHAEV